MTDSASGQSARPPIRLGQARARARSRAQTRWRRNVAAALSGIARFVGLRRSLLVDGVRYIEREPTPLRRALSARGQGSKDFDVRFPDGESIRIHCSAKRIYADLMPDPRLPLYRFSQRWVRPGMRVLELGCGTGAGSMLLSLLTGPSGSVVSLDPDGESVRFARRRYPQPNLAFEIGAGDALRGELDGAFDAAFLDARLLTHLPEVWRCLAPDGSLALWPPASSFPDLPDLAGNTDVFDPRGNRIMTVLLKHAPNPASPDTPRSENTDDA